MKILYLTSRFPYPLEKGDKLRVYHHIKALHALGHEVVLCALNDAPVDEEMQAALSPFCSAIHVLPLSKWNFIKRIPAWFFQAYPIQLGFFWKGDMANKIKAIAAATQPDLVWTQLIRMSDYSKNLPYFKVLDIMDTLSANTLRWAENKDTNFFLRFILHREAKLLKAYEAKIMKAYDANFIISQQDAALLPAQPNNLHVLPNGVDSNYFDKNVVLHLYKPDQQYDIVFVGNMGYAPNVAAAQYLITQIMPLLWQKYPNLKVLLAGARPSAEVQDLSKHPLVSVSGWIDDIREAYLNAKMMIAPLFIGSGQQNKILEAMAMSLPCITTTLVNNAIGAKHEESLFIADDAMTFAKYASQLLENKNKSAQIAQTACAFVRNNYSWNAHVQHIMATISAINK